jgi:hypothetical protein
MNLKVVSIYMITRTDLKNILQLYDKNSSFLEKAPNEIMQLKQIAEKSSLDKHDELAILNHLLSLSKSKLKQSPAISALLSETIRILGKDTWNGYEALFDQKLLNLSNIQAMSDKDILKSINQLTLYNTDPNRKSVLDQQILDLLVLAAQDKKQDSNYNPSRVQLITLFLIEFWKYDMLTDNTIRFLSQEITKDVQLCATDEVWKNYKPCMLPPEDKKLEQENIYFEIISTNYHHNKLTLQYTYLDDKGNPIVKTADVYTPEIHKISPLTAATLQTLPSIILKNKIDHHIRTFKKALVNKLLSLALGDGFPKAMVAKLYFLTGMNFSKTYSPDSIQYAAILIKIINIFDKANCKNRDNIEEVLYGKDINDTLLTLIKIYEKTGLLNDRNIQNLDVLEIHKLKEIIEPLSERNLLSQHVLDLIVSGCRVKKIESGGKDPEEAELQECRSNGVASCFLLNNIISLKKQLTIKTN